MSTERLLQSPPAMEASVLLTKATSHYRRITLGGKGYWVSIVEKSAGTETFLSLNDSTWKRVSRAMQQSFHTQSDSVLKKNLSLMETPIGNIQNLQTAIDSTDEELAAQPAQIPDISAFSADPDAVMGEEVLKHFKPTEIQIEEIEDTDPLKQKYTYVAEGKNAYVLFDKGLNDDEKKAIISKLKKTHSKVYSPKKELGLSEGGLQRAAIVLRHEFAQHKSKRKSFWQRLRKPSLEDRYLRICEVCSHTSTLAQSAAKISATVYERLVAQSEDGYSS